MGLGLIGAGGCCRVSEGAPLSPSRRQMYLINCMVAVQAALADHHCCA